MLQNLSLYFERKINENRKMGAVYLDPQIFMGPSEQDAVLVTTPDGHSRHVLVTTIMSPPSQRHEACQSFPFFLLRQSQGMVREKLVCVERP